MAHGQWPNVHTAHTCKQSTGACDVYVAVSHRPQDVLGWGVLHRLSKRQRLLYEEYMGNSETRNTLAGGSFLGIINVLMQLRKVRSAWPHHTLSFLAHHSFCSIASFGIEAVRCMLFD